MGVINAVPPPLPPLTPLKLVPQLLLVLLLLLLLPLPTPILDTIDWAPTPEGPSAPAANRNKQIGVSTSISKHQTQTRRYNSNKEFFDQQYQWNSSSVCTGIMLLS
jgi:hypothetical protein